ncbi:MAG: B12-binding domain-containing radical SAM protein [Candidatus Omnitrophica bacterium]|nr:B12-binding domain-containing radical SAM protein [Candidatus Omnitrophota bacterium]
MKVFLICPPIRPKMKMDLSSGCLALEAYLRSKERKVDVYRGEVFDTDVFVKQVKSSRPDILGMTCDCLNMDYCFALAKIVKKITKNIYIVLGGPQATFLDRLILERIPWIDAVIRGEGEETLAEIVDRCEDSEGSVDLTKVQGLSYRNNQEVLVNDDRSLIKDLDRLPLPQKDMTQRYVGFDGHTPADEKLFFVETGRGCSSSCQFCNDVGVWQRKPRQKSVERIIKEVNFFKEHGKAKKFFFRENTFTADRSRTMSFCQHLIRHKVDIEWECGTRVDAVDKNLLKTMKEAGCRSINYGVESLSDPILKAMNKGFSSSLAMNVIRETHRAGIMPDYNIILGYPGETEGTLAETFHRIEELGIYGHPDGVQEFRLVSGSRIYMKMKKLGLVSDDVWFNGCGGVYDFCKKYYPVHFQNRLSFYEQEIRKLRHSETFLHNRLK